MTTVKQFISNNELTQSSIDAARENEQLDEEMNDSTKDIQEVLKRLKSLGYEVQQQRGVQDIPEMYLSNQVKLIQEANSSYIRELNKYNIEDNLTSKLERPVLKREDSSSYDNVEWWKDQIQGLSISKKGIK